MNPSLYAQYRQERGEATLIEREHGFASYSIKEEECYIQDIFVTQEQRKSGLAKEMADSIAEIAKEQGCTFISGSVVVGSKDATKSMKVLLAYGMRLWLVSGNILYMKKDI